MIQNDKKFDLGERTFEFSKRLIKLLRSLSKEPAIQTIVLQAIRSGTAIGANYREADGAESKKDFLHKIGICKKEAKETLYWLGLIKEGLEVKSDEMERLIDECRQLVRIFGKISVS
ncbi:four helix bundle protein [Candidatus Amesbacteria bacterium]|nr:four helix bundle protein [Candidatus Amesbacteria bacterium]MBI2587370.1 four helix bundle protein [Candidatus Amesbacteria bacterium]